MPTRFSRALLASGIMQRWGARTVGRTQGVAFAHTRRFNSSSFEEQHHRTMQGPSVLSHAFLGARAYAGFARAFAAAATSDQAYNAGAGMGKPQLIAPLPPLPRVDLSLPPKAKHEPSLWPTLWRILRSKMGWLVVSAGLAIAASALGLASPALIGQLWDSLGGMGAAGGRESLGPALKLGALFLGRFFLQLLSGAMLSSVSEDVANELRRTLFTHLLEADLGLFDSSRTADLMTALTDDVREVRDTLRAVFGEGIPAAVRVIGGSVALAMTSSKLSLALAGALVPMFYVGTTLGARLRRLARQSAEMQGQAAGVANESMSHVRVVRAYTGEENEVKRYTDALEDGSALTRRIGLEYSGFRALVSLGLTSLAGAMLLYGNSLVARGELTRGSVTSFLMQSFSLEGALESLNMLGAKVARAQGSGSRVAGLLESKPAVLMEGTVQWPGLLGEVEFKDVHFAYPTRPDVPVLKGVTLRLPPGKTVALVGPSGSGKSTIAALLLGLYEPTMPSLPLPTTIQTLNASSSAADAYHSPTVSHPAGSASSSSGLSAGHQKSGGADAANFASIITKMTARGPGYITVDGRPLGAVDIKWLRSRSAVVPQEPALFATTLRKNIAYGCHSADEVAVQEAAQQAHAWEFIHRLPRGLDTVVGERGVSLSGGQRQRIALARALLRDPRILILDEATSALDAESEASVQAALKEAMQHRTTLVIAHRLSTVQRADLIYVLEGGMVVESGTHGELLGKGGVYAGLVARQRDGIVGG